MKKSLFSALWSAGLLLMASTAFAGSLTGTLDSLFSAPESSSSSSSSSSPSEAEPATEPAPPPPPPAEFYPGAEPVYTTKDPLVGDSRGLVRMPDGSMKFVEKDVNGNVTSETPVPAADAEKFKPTEPGGTVDLDKLPDGTWEVRQYDQDGNLVSVDPLSGQEKEEPQEAPAPAPARRQRELPSASMTDPATGITTTSQGNPDGSRTVTKTDADGNVISEERMPARGEGLPSASSYDPKTGVTTTSQGNADGSRTVTKSEEVGPTPAPMGREGAPAGSAAPTPATIGREGESQDPPPAAQPAQPGQPEPAAPVGGAEGGESILDEIDQQPAPSATAPSTPSASQEPPRESVLDDIEESDRAAAAERTMTPTQAGRAIEQAGREGRVEANPADWERDAAEGLGAAFGADSPEEAAALAERNRQAQDATSQPRRDEQASGDLQRRLDDARVRADEEGRRERKEAADRASLERLRHNAEEDLRRYEESLDTKLKAEGRTNLTEQEFIERQRREDRFLDLATATPEEQAEIDRNAEVRDRVIRTIRENADNDPDMSPEEVAERLQNERMSDAATKTWRDYTFSGKMVSEVREDIYRQREQGIENNNQVEAAQNFLRRRNISPEERATAEQYLAMQVTQRGHNAEAILYDGAVVTTGVAADVGTMAVGGTISRGVSKVMGYIRGTPPIVLPSATPPVAPPPAVRPPATTAPRPIPSKPLEQMTRAERQAYNDALGRHAVAEATALDAAAARPGASAATRAQAAEMNFAAEGGSSTILPPPAATGRAAGQVAAEAGSEAGQLSRNLAQNQIDDLFRPGANLTRDQLMQKTDLMLSGRVHPTYRPPTPPGTLPQGAGDASTRLFPGRAAAQVADETGTMINPGRAPAPPTNAPSFRSSPTEVMPPSASQISEAAAEMQAAAARAEAAGGKTIIERPSAPQAHNDALARRAVQNRPRNPSDSQIDEITGGNDVLPGPVTEQAAGQLSRGLSQAQIDDLFRPGANLTRDQLVQKTDLLLSGKVPPTYRPIPPPPPPLTAEQLAARAAQELAETKNN